MRNFDRFIGIDWTGAKSPVNSKSIAIADCRQGNDAPTLINGSWSRTKVADYISNLTQQEERVLIGIDANFGYEYYRVLSHLAHFSRQDRKRNNAFHLWKLVDDLCVGEPNFFASGFWTHPTLKPDFWTEGPQPDGFKLPRRRTEKICQQEGHGKPESPFKLIGAKQVGKGGLAAMRMAHYLKQHHGDSIKIWPFENNLIKGDETVLPYDTARVVITEIYPRQFIKRAGFGNNKIRNRTELNQALSALGSKHYKGMFNSDHDTDALIAAVGLRYLCGDKPDIPKNLHAPFENSNHIQTEGWIFGVGFEK